MMLDDLGEYLSGRVATPKTVTKKSDKTRSTVVNPDQLEEFFGDEEKPASPLEKSGFSTSTPDAIPRYVSLRGINSRVT